ncbi:MAG: dihydrofolate reductase family protein [Leadbetterella sp.]|nr:dihydrofolate reductase family protein [Leadbetterella sp.]
MRKLIMWDLITLNGYFEGGKSWDLDFHDLVWGEELERFSIEQLKSADVLVFGEVTYEGMAKYWPKEKGEIADFMNRIQKVVCSPMLKSADWNNTTIVKDAVADLPKLKQQGDGNMFVFGSGTLSNALIKANLFDEYRLCVAPVILNDGRRLFEDGLPYQKLTLLEARPLTTGGVILQYQFKK